MKKRFAKFFLLLAKRLDPQTHIENAQYIEDYEAKKIGIAFKVTKKEIQDFRFQGGIKMGEVEGKRRLVNYYKDKIRESIINTIDDNHLIEFELTNEGRGFTLFGQLRVYVPKTN